MKLTGATELKIATIPRMKQIAHTYIVVIVLHLNSSVQAAYAFDVTFIAMDLMTVVTIQMKMIITA